MFYTDYRQFSNLGKSDIIYFNLRIYSFKKLIVLRASKDWNNLHMNVKSADKILVLKKLLDKYIENSDLTTSFYVSI